MKHLILLIAFFYFFNNQAQTGFNKYYPSGEYSYGHKLKYINQNEFLLISAYQDSSATWRGIDLKLIDNQGLVTKRKRHSFPNCDFSFYNDYYNYNTQDNNSTQIDISNSTMILTSGAFFTSINKSTLDTNWTKNYYDSTYFYYINSVVRLKQNEIWLIGTRTSNPSSSGNMLATIKIDTIGNILAVKEFTNMTEMDLECISADSSAGLLYIASNRYSDFQNYVTCMDTIGTIIWDKQITNSFVFFPSPFYQIEKRNNYLVLSWGKVVSPYGNSSFSKVGLLKLNSNNGNVIWDRSYGKKGYSFLTGFIINNDESIVAAGNIDNSGIYYPGLNWNGCILKVNSNGDSLWMRQYSNYGAGIPEEFSDVQACPDGGYVLCGSPFDGWAGYHSWVVKTDSLGNGPGVVVPSTITAIAELKGEGSLTLYPNPAANLVILQADDEVLNGGPVKLMVFNSAGELIKEEQPDFKNKRAVLKTGDLQNGIYFVKLQCDNKIFVSKLVIVK